jgi:hypothetical protein
MSAGSILSFAITRRGPSLARAKRSLAIGDFGHETGLTFQSAERYAIDERAASFDKTWRLPDIEEVK